MTTLLVDGNNILARATFAARGKGVQMSVGETSTAALQIFIMVLSKYVRRVEPTRMAVFWDAGHALRDAAYPEYKAARKKSVDGEDSLPMAQVKEFLTWAGVPHKSHTGYEADDMIAATVRGSVGRVVILSDDKDLLQLTHDSRPVVHNVTGEQQWREVTQIRPTGDIEWTEHHVDEAFGVPAHHLSHYLALVGDPGDGVPGVQGIGPKKALALLAKAEWDWETVGDLLGPEKAAQASLMHRLVDLRTYPYDEVFMAVNAGAPPFNPRVPDDGASWAALMAFCDQYQLETVRQRLESRTLWRDAVDTVEVFADM